MEFIAPWIAVAIAAASLAFAVYSYRSRAASERVTGIEGRVDKLEERTTRVEAEIRHLPDKDSTHRMELAIGDLRADVRVIAEQLKPVAATSSRLQEYMLEQAKQATQP